MRIRIVGSHLPGSTCGEYTNVHVGVQCGKEPDQLVPGDAKEAVFEFDVQLKDGDFRGPYVHGRKGERFLYLTWGELPPGGTFAMFRRAKLYLSDVDESLIQADAVLEAEMPMTDRCGMPICASVRPLLISWGESRRSSRT